MATPNEPREPDPKRGRKTKLTPEVQEAITSALEAGSYFVDACVAAGVSRKTGYEWMQRGESQEKRKVRGRFRDFRDAVLQARPKGKVELERVAYRGAKSDPPLALRMLSLIDPKKWGPKVQVTVQEELNSALDRLRTKLAPEEYERVLEALAADDLDLGAGEAGGDPSLPRGGGSGGTAPDVDPEGVSEAEGTDAPSAGD